MVCSSLGTRGNRKENTYTMKKALSLLIALAILLASTALAATPPTAEVKALRVGTVQVFDYGALKLHAYATQDALGDVNYLLETATSLIAIEAPAFTANLDEYAQYIVGLGKPMNCALLAYHPTGADYFAGVQVLGTKEAQASQQEGGSIKGLVDSFVTTFGEGFNGNLTSITDVVEPGTVTVDGVDFVITATADAYDIEIPAINAVYTHMMGSNVHNILASTEQIDGMIAQLKAYQAKDYDLVLTGHYVPETIEAVETKITYLEKTKEIIASSNSPQSFITAMQEAFPDYAGVNYLEMSGGMLFS